MNSGLTVIVPLPRICLHRILSAPYEDRDGWTINVMFLHDTLYFEEHMTDEKLAEK